MDGGDVNERVQKILSQVMGVPMDRVTEDCSPHTLSEWDSLKHMNLVLALEEAFDVLFTDAEIGEIVTVPKILEGLKRHGATA